jgi:hypothetical protein
MPIENGTPPVWKNAGLFLAGVILSLSTIWASFVKGVSARCVVFIRSCRSIVCAVE